ncbi:hypothetical protein [Shewanella metallivivens]|uniref:Uncharacterized protein n=1 Tax=Shewanella metallivivens TaxID=2872342 RepID=A0ABT5THM4_9GAMM|nr:hypothetical protein [Shewanella metallivivens]MDD8058118.1 hypothetical protein [Shewanella metallivivens]
MRTLRPSRSASSGLPEYGLPEYGLPEYGLPEYGLPEYGLPEYGLPTMERYCMSDKDILEACVHICKNLI